MNFLQPPILLLLMTSYFVKQVTSSECSRDVTITCQSCDGKSAAVGGLKGRLGEELKLIIEVNNQKFKIIDIFFNKSATNNENQISFSPSRLRIRKKGYGDGFRVPDSITKSGSKVSLNITLSELTSRFDGLVFGYRYTQGDLKTYQCTMSTAINVLDGVSDPEKSRSALSGASRNVAVVAGSLVSLIICFLFHSWNVFCVLCSVCLFFTWNCTLIFLSKSVKFYHKTFFRSSSRQEKRLVKLYKNAWA